MFTPGAFAQNACSVDYAQNQSPIHYQLEPGQNSLTLDCNLSAPLIVVFDDMAIDAVRSLSGNEQLYSSAYAFVIQAGVSQPTFTISSSVHQVVTLRTETPSDFNRWSQLHTLTMGIFAGICIALCLYITMLGKSMKDKAFFAYSAYVLSACVFFILQERLTNLLFPNIPIVHDMYTSALFAGLTVFTGQRFLSQLLEFRRILPYWLYRTLHILGISMLLLAAIPALTQSQTTHFMLALMGYVTTLIAIIIIPSTLWAVLKNIHVSYLVLLAQVLLAGAMMVRLYFSDSFPFLAQYSLIIALTLESLILAFAVSEKVKRLNDQKEAAQASASTDDLCPVLNRRGWYREALSRLEQIKESDEKLVLIFIDIDKFKQINDVFGHINGDRVLIAFSNIIKHQARPTDIIGRIGGDEFVVLSPCKTNEHASKLVERLQDRLEGLRINVDDKQIPVSASIGFQIASDTNNELSTLLHGSDVAMYKVKAAKASA